MWLLIFNSFFYTKISAQCNNFDVTTIAGTIRTPGSMDGNGTVARFFSPFGVSTDRAGNIYVADFANHTIRKITQEGDVTTIAGTAGIIGNNDGVGISARFNGPVDVTIDEALKNEGIARELVNRIQNLRKESGLEVTDKIELRIQKDGNVEKAIESNKAYLKSETLTEILNLEEHLEEGTEVTFDEIQTKLFIQKH